MLNCQ